MLRLQNVIVLVHTTYASRHKYSRASAVVLLQCEEQESLYCKIQHQRVQKVNELV